MYKRTFSPRQQFRINERIFANSLRVLDIEGKQVGVLSKTEALNKARELGVDLVEVAPQATPPVARLIDYNKFLYQVEKKKREEKRKAKSTETKEVRLGPFMGAADLDNMTNRAKGFLQDGNKVRLVLKFRGRQIVHPEFGHETIQKMVAALADVSKVEKEPRLEGKQLIAIISPERKKTKNEEENQELSSQTV
ncbi:MAG TPA: translation initiation factor IF-3 [Gammaproteobacteria bacterium]|nr:translation initiation factor IF-3 [Gammaproteobacteria bacterium]